MDAFTETQCYSVVFDVIISSVLLTILVIFWRNYDWDSSKKPGRNKGLLYGTLLGRINEKLLFIIFASPFVILVGFFTTEKLETRIDEYGIHYKMFPVQWNERTVGWNEIYRTEVRDYIIYSRTVAAYEVYSIDDKYGLYIFLHNGKKVIIGTKKPDEITRALWQYR
jgi:hypothetical protein